MRVTGPAGRCKKRPPTPARTGTPSPAGPGQGRLSEEIQGLTAFLAGRAAGNNLRPALRGWLEERTDTGWISSVLTEIESFRALARYAPDAVSRLPAVLDQIDLIDLGPGIPVLAQTAKPVTVRSLDAIHLGTALHSRSGLTSFVTYDERLLEAAQAAGLPADSPAQQKPATPSQAGPHPA